MNASAADVVTQAHNCIERKDADSALRLLAPFLDNAASVEVCLLAAQAYALKKEWTHALKIADSAVFAEDFLPIATLKISAYTDLARYSEALTIAQNVLQQSGFTTLSANQEAAVSDLAPDNVEPVLSLDFWKAYAFLLMRLRRHQEAVAILAPLWHKNNDDHTQSLLGLSELALGRFTEGWRHYEGRWAVFPALNIPRPRWHGEAINGKRLLIASEQGFGDTIHFLRYLPLLKAQSKAHLVILVPATLARLVRLMPIDIEVIVWHHDEAVTLEDVDYYLPLLSAPLALNKAEPFWPQEPYIKANPYEVILWQQRIARGLSIAEQALDPQKNSINPKKIGLVWAGSNDGEVAGIANFRSLFLRQLASLAEVEDAAFFSLQLGEEKKQLAMLGAAGVDFLATSQIVEKELTLGLDYKIQVRSPSPRWSGPLIHDLTAYMSDFADTAAFIENLDLVICCDTAVVHLAGALGKPVWMLNRYSGCWRWLPGQAVREDSPWYPSVRLFTQTKMLEWDGVVSRLVEALKIFIKE